MCVVLVHTLVFFFCFGGFVLEILFLGDSFSDMKGLWASCQRTDCFPIGRDYRQQVKRTEREREREREDLVNKGNLFCC